ncbi:MAG: phosphatase PAP2 family protein [Myxococcales bacterium]|nr:phosphatase PAP2 family protein [Myxococcales bacterium]
MRALGVALFSLLGIAGLPAAVSPASAAPSKFASSNDPSFHLVPMLDVPLLALDAAVLLGLKAVVPQRHEDGRLSDLFALDAPVARNGRDDDALRTSDFGGLMAGAFALVDAIVTARHNDLDAGVITLGLYAESAMTTAAVTEVVKLLVQRPRPCTYQIDRRERPPLHCGQDDDDAYLSFFSGHTAVTAALSTTATYLAFERDADGSRAAWTVSGGLALTSFVAVERMRAGKHFPTDVITGAVVGAGIGFLVPHLHKGGAQSATGLSSDGRMLTLASGF